MKKVILVCLLALGLAGCKLNEFSTKGVVQCALGFQVLGCEYTSIAVNGNSFDVQCKDGSKLRVPQNACIVLEGLELPNGAAEATVEAK